MEPKVNGQTENFEMHIYMCVGLIQVTTGVTLNNVIPANNFY